MSVIGQVAALACVSWTAVKSTGLHFMTGAVAAVCGDIKTLKPELFATGITQMLHFFES